MTEYELEHMPHSSTGQRMLSRVSPIYDKSLFMKDFYEAVGTAFDEVRKFFETLREQNFTTQVTWGIEYLEHKYSIVPDRSLSLEERRARLKIKTTPHRPLNPAVLEKAARDLFDIEIFLDESTAGYITFEVEFTDFERVEKFIKYLLVEKPAHLMLRVIMHRKIETEIFVGTAVHEHGKIKIDRAEKPPFIGNAVYQHGRIIIGRTGKPPFIGTAVYQHGHITIGQTEKPPFVAAAVYQHGNITIDVCRVNTGG